MKAQVKPWFAPVLVLTVLEQAAVQAQQSSQVFGDSELVVLEAKLEIELEAVLQAWSLLL